MGCASSPRQVGQRDRHVEHHESSGEHASDICLASTKQSSSAHVHPLAAGSKDLRSKKQKHAQGLARPLAGLVLSRAKAATVIIAKEAGCCFPPILAGMTAMTGWPQGSSAGRPTVGDCQPGRLSPGGQELHASMHM